MLYLSSDFGSEYDEYDRLVGWIWCWNDGLKLFGINEYDDTEKKDKELDEEMSETRRHEHRDYC